MPPFLASSVTLRSFTWIPPVQAAEQREVSMLQFTPVHQPQPEPRLTTQSCCLSVAAGVGNGVVVVVVGDAVVFGGLWQWYFSGVSVVEGGATHPALLLRRRLSENVALWLNELLVQMQSGLPGVRHTDVGSV